MTVNARQRVDLTLKVGDVGETVEVDRRGDAARDRVERSRPGHRQGADRQPAAERPRLRRPGAAQPRRPHARRSPTRATPRSTSTACAARVNNFILDGVDNNSYGTSNQGFSNQVVQVSPDAVEEFKVQTNNFSAEFGRTGGAVINAIDPQRHQPVPRHRLGVQPQHRAERDRLLQAVERREAEARTATSSASSSAARSCATAPSSSPTTKASARCTKTLTFASIPTMAQRAGHPRQADRQSAHRRDLRRRRDPGERDHAVRAQGAGRPAGADARRHRRTTSTRCRAARTTTTSSTSRSISSSARG